MSKEELTNYIKTSLASGKTKDEIKLVLSGTGWQDKDIKKAFASVAGGTTENSQNVYSTNGPAVENAGMAYCPQADLGMGGMTQGDSYSDIPPVSDQISSAWGSFKRGFLPALAVMSAVTILSTIPSLIMLSSPNTGSIVLLIMILPIVALSIWAELVIYNIVVNEGENGWSQFGKSISKIIPFTWVGILTSLIAMGGFFLLIVPAVIFSIWFSLSQFILLKEDVRGFKSLFKSKEYVRGSFWTIFARMLILIVIGIAAGIPVGFITALTGVAGPYVKAIISMLLNIPLRVGLSLFGVAYMYEIYKGLKGKKGDVEFQTTTGKKVGFSAIAIWGLIAPIIFIILIMGIILAIFMQQGNLKQIDSGNQNQTGGITSPTTSSSRSKANDTKRRADLARIQNALEDCFDESTQSYPVAFLKDQCVVSKFDNGLPKDPSTNMSYNYIASGNPPERYELSAQMEDSDSTGVDENGMYKVTNKQGTK